jgi:tRNA (guanine26-N2/guanine27-N2)-dimethyltransferase
MNIQDDSATQVTIEGRTKLVVPARSLTERVPPKTPAFFNPAAKLSRDLSVIAYNAFSDQLNELRDRGFADGFSGVGSRALRVAVEVPSVDRVHLNDANPYALSLAKSSAELNAVYDKCSFSVNEVCNFLLKGPSEVENSAKERFGIIDLDPFGTPARHIDCVLKSVTNGGLISITATDTAVLCGIYPEVCLRRYYGLPLNTEYGNEIALRLIYSLVAMTASRLEMSISPLFCHASMHYMRIYAKAEVSSSKANEIFKNLGTVYHCGKCGNRYESSDACQVQCNFCSSKLRKGGPLWLGKINDSEFVSKMSREEHDAHSGKVIDTSLSELSTIPYYFTVDEVAKSMKRNPLSVTQTIENLRLSGFLASGTPLNTTGFKTNATIEEIRRVMA